MKTHIAYLTIILLLVLGWVVHFVHHLEVEKQLEALQAVQTHE